MTRTLSLIHPLLPLMLAQFFQKYIKLNLEKKGNAYINLLHCILFQKVDSSDAR